MLFRAEKARSYLAYRTRLTHHRCCRDLGGSEWTAPVPSDSARKLCKAQQITGCALWGSLPRKIFFLKLSESLLYFSFLFYLFIVCILGWSSRKRSPSAILRSSPHCPRVIERWAPGALRQVGDRCSGMLGTGAE